MFHLNEPIIIAAKQHNIPARCLEHCTIDSVFFLSVFNNFAKWLRWVAFKLHWNSWNSLLLATKEHSLHVHVLPLLTNSKPTYWFVVHHDSMNVNRWTRERTCAINTMPAHIYNCHFYQSNHLMIAFAPKGPSEPTQSDWASLYRCIAVQYFLTSKCILRKWNNRPLR